MLYSAAGSRAGSRARGILVCLLASAFASPAVAQRPEPPPFYAVRDARVVVGNGEVLERATVLIADGLIEAVGGGLEVPPDAWVVEGEGLTLYPGLIDAMTDLGLAAAEESPRPGGGRPGGGGSGATVRGPEDRPATTPWRRAADLLADSDARVERWREAGFTAAVTVPADGFFPGQAALIHLGDVEPRERVLAPAVAQRLGFEGGAARQFPGSLMGAIAYQRQVFADAEYHALAGHGASYDRALEPLRAAVEERRPFLMPASRAREIDRVLALAAEWRLQPILFGGHDGYARAERLRAAAVPVLVSLDWPEADADADPDADTPLPELYRRRRAPSTPLALKQAGVPFAFTSGGLDSPSKALAGVRAAVDAGLPGDAALEALTLGAARVFGAGDSLGSIEAGKVANLVLASAEPWAEDVEIRAVFVDGRKYQPTPEDEKDHASPDDEDGENSDEDDEDGEDDGEPAVSLEELERAMALYRGPARELTAFAIAGARVYTVSGAILDDATVVVEGGKIAAVGTGVAIPEGTEVFDAGGGSLIPGIVDAHSHIAGEGALNEGSVAVSSIVTVDDVIDPDDIAIYRALAGGVTTVNVLHGSSNPIGGGNAVLKLRWGSGAEALRFAGAPPGIKFALGENPKRSRRDPPPGVERRYPATRMGVMDVIRQAFTEAREYQKEWHAYSQTGEGATPPRRDFRLERLVEVLEGERLVHAHSYRADEILQLLRLAEELGFRIATLQHVLEGYKVADEIAAHGAGASTFSDWWGYKIEAYDAIPHNAALMNERGVLVSINSDSGEEMRHLNHEAAKAVKWGGLSENEALALVTLNPAKQLRIADRVGSIEVGKDADLVLYDGPPLSVFSVVQKTFVDGDLYFDRDADRERQAAIDAIKEKLRPKGETQEEQAE